MNVIDSATAAAVLGISTDELAMFAAFGLLPAEEGDGHEKQFSRSRIELFAAAVRHATGRAAIVKIQAGGER